MLKIKPGWWDWCCWVRWTKEFNKLDGIPWSEPECDDGDEWWRTEFNVDKRTFVGGCGWIGDGAADCVDGLNWPELPWIEPRFGGNCSCGIRPWWIETGGPFGPNGAGTLT